MTDRVSLHDAHFEELPAAARLLTDAFSTGPIIEWAEPDPRARARLLEPCFTAMVHHSVGHVRLARHDYRPGRPIVGVALWIPEPAPTGVDLDDLMAQLPAGTAVNRLALLEAAAARQRPDRAYHHLAYLGVHPQWQRHGIGSRLLTDHLTQLATRGVPAYLEASNPDNRTLYQRHGFTDLGQPIAVDDSPPIWPMWHPGTTTGRPAEPALQADRS